MSSLSLYDSARESETDDETEATKWTKKETVKLAKNANSLKLPMVINKTMTVVETTRAVPEERVKRKIAKQYKKRRDKRVIFFVAARPWAGWRECREVLVVVTAPAHLSKELGRHLTHGYCLLSMSGEFRVPPLTDFRVSVVGDLFVEHGEVEAVVTFHHVLRTDQGGNYAAFVLRTRSERATQGKFLIMQKRKKMKKVINKGDPAWKYKGELHFDIARVGQDLRTPGVEQEELTLHFSDRLLLDLAEQVPASEAALLGIRLGLSHSQVDNVMSNPNIMSPVFKCFELLRRQRDRSKDTVMFGQRLVEALESMEWNQQCDWLRKELQRLPRLNEAEVKSKT